MAKSEIKNKAIELRKQGLSILEITKNLGVSKSSVSLWCRDIILTEAQQGRLVNKMIDSGHKGRMLGALTNIKKKEESIKICHKWAEKIFSTMSDRDFLVSGIALYWSEGSKSTHGNLSFVNSDPKMIVLMYKWLQCIFETKPEDFILRVSINELHRYRIEEVLNFWSNLLDFPKGHFKKTIFIKTKQNKVYINHNTYFGLLIIRVKKSTLIKYKILALIELISNAGVAQVVRAFHS